MLHPRFLLGALEPSAYEVYKAKNRVRALQSYKVMSEMMINNSLVKIKDAPPYTIDIESPVLLNSMARATLDEKTGSYSFKNNLNTKPIHDVANVKAVSEILSSSGPAAGVGVDQGMFHFFLYNLPSKLRFQNSSLPFHHGILPLSAATSQMPRFLTAAHSPRRKLRSPDVGLGRRRSSNRLA